MSECKTYTAGSSITGNGGGTSNLPGDLLIFTNGVWSSVSSSAHTACPCRSTLGIKSLITNGLLEQYSPAHLHCGCMRTFLPFPGRLGKIVYQNIVLIIAMSSLQPLLDLLLVSDHLKSFCPLFLPEFGLYHLELSIPMATLDVLLHFYHWQKD